MSVKIKKIVTQKETINYEGFKDAVKPINRVVVAAVIDNPYAGKYSENLDELIGIGEELGDILTKIGLEQLPGQVENYAKGAIVGLNGELEHGGATLHPKLGATMRKAIGLPCSALISCNKKVAGPGATIDLPLMFRDEAAIRTHYDTIPNFGIPGAPKANEMIIMIALTDGGRPNPRIGGQTLADYEKKRAESK
ncbi:amino acid synthesis family protein [Desulfovibrio sp. OttesenSCG-928-C06]|nr:amino acid synthesis family protein [Desulfovibrio sp. OttesenSCG-928-C06]